MNQQILEQYGLAEEETERNKPDIEDCPQCQTPLRGDPRFCPGCGLALSQKAAHDLDQTEDGILTDVADATDEDEVEMLTDLRELVEEHPDAVHEALRRSGEDAPAWCPTQDGHATRTGKPRPEHAGAPYRMAATARWGDCVEVIGTSPAPPPCSLST